MITSEPNVTTGVVDTLHGIAVNDPFRWLEHRNEEATNDWLARQRTRFEAYFQGLPELEHLTTRVKQLLDRPTDDQVAKVGGKYFFRRRNPGEEQFDIFVRNGDLASHDRCLIRANNFGSYASVSLHRVSSDANFLAFEVKVGGEHTKTIRLMNVTSGTMMPEFLDRGHACGFVFHKEGYFYSHDLAEPDGAGVGSHSIRFHEYGSPNSRDVMLLSFPRTGTSKLVLRGNDSCLGAHYYHHQNTDQLVDVYWADPKSPQIWHAVQRDALCPFGVFFVEHLIFVHTLDSSGRSTVLRLDPIGGSAQSIIVPGSDQQIYDMVAAGGRFYVRYQTEQGTLIRLWSLDGDDLGLLNLDDRFSWDLLPTFSTSEDEFFLRRQSFTAPPTLFRINATTRELRNWGNEPEEVDESVVVEETQYQTRDSETIAITLVGKAETLKRPSPVIMTAYGGFGIAVRPQYSVFVNILLEFGFVFVLPHIRGGGERGLKWHEAAKGTNRQVSFDDFIDASEWLLTHQRVIPGKLAIFGGCNAGLLVGAVMTQRPELFAAVVCIAPLLDMVRYHLFDRARIWIHEYGCSEDLSDFRALLALSPYHNVRQDVDYPAVLFVCGDKDSRCNALHARKMTAQLQEREAQTRPILLDHSTERGHSPTLPLHVRIDALSRRIAFVCKEVAWPQITLEEPHDLGS